jgi:hypothetical protein
VTPQQRIAIARHCRFAFETAHEDFRYLVAHGRASIVLTVNSGYE